MSHMGTVHIKLIIICHVRHGVGVQFQSGEEHRGMISGSPCSKCQRKPTALCGSHTLTVCQSQVESHRNEKPQQQKHFILTVISH